MLLATSNRIKINETIGTFIISHSNKSGFSPTLKDWNKDVIKDPDIVHLLALPSWVYQPCLPYMNKLAAAAPGTTCQKGYM